MPTYNSTTYDISDGDSTTYDTTETNIRIDSAECRWRGESTSSTTTTSVENTNTSGDKAAGDNVYELEIPDISPDTFEEHEFLLRTDGFGGEPENDSGLSVDVEIYSSEGTGSALQYESRDNTTFTQTFRLTDVTDTQWRFDTTTQDFTGASSVSSTYWVYIFTYNAGNTYAAEVVSEGRNSTTTTTDTQDPSVNVNSGSGSASYSGTIGDGNWTSYQNMTGMKEGTNTFDHSISGSNEADWEFNYTYSFTYPTRQGEMRVYVNATGSEIRIPLVDPNDAELDYSVMMVYHDTDGKIYAVDAVDESNSDATGFKFYHPTHGTLAARKYNV